MFRRHNGFRAERVWLLSKRLTLHTISMSSAIDTVELDPVLKFDASGCIQWPNQILCVFWSWLKSSVKCRKRMRWFCRNGTWSWVPEENPAQPISPNPLLQSSRPAHTRCNFTCTPPSNLVVIIYIHGTIFNNGHFLCMTAGNGCEPCITTINLQIS